MADFSCVLEYSLEYSSMQGNISVGIEGKGLAGENLRDVGRNLICLLFVFILRGANRLALIVRVNQFSGFIQVNGPEFPILDGSASMYVEKIQSVGIQEQNAEKDYYIIRHKIEVKDDNGSVITILPDEEFSITAMCSFESKFINSQFATLDKMETYVDEIASARTFVFVRDIMPLLQANLIKGGDLDNAIVIYERQVEQAQLDQLADHLKVPHMDASKLGYIQHRPLQWENECTRHKLLDIIGDMALIGKPIKGRIIATRPGHTVNNKFARLMRKEIRKHEIQAPIYDPNEEPIMDNIRILDDCASYVIIADNAVMPTSELPSHLSVHARLIEKGSNYKATVHTHPIELIAMSHNKKFMGKDVLSNLLWSMIPETKAFCPLGLGIVPYQLPGSLKLAEETLKELEDYDVVMWEKHGVFAKGLDVMDAFDQIDVLSKSAKIYIDSKCMGFEPDGMSQEEMAEMTKAFNLPR